MTYEQAVALRDHLKEVVNLGAGDIPATHFSGVYHALSWATKLVNKLED